MSDEKGGTAAGDPTRRVAEAESERIEMRLLTEAIYLKYGYDFRGYAEGSLRRRILKFVSRSGADNISALQHLVLNDSGVFEGLLRELSVAVTEMFRDPPFFQALVQHVFPVLARNEHNRVWVAGCASGEEAYSLAILLREAGLYDRTKLFATDINEELLHTASQGVFPLANMAEYTSAYQQAGGRSAFVDYYTARYDSALLDASLRRNMVFAHHNLATDGVFGEFDLILCRNVLIYFGRELQDRVLDLFADSLGAGAFLALGTHESVRFSTASPHFEPVMKTQRIYRRR